jgi:uncharacterized membrane protein YraQ (UPF0718 family)
MRLVLLLITALIIGFLLEKQLNTSSSDSNTETYSGIPENGAVPNAPKSREDIQNLRKDLNNLMQNTTDKRNDSIEQSLNNK